MKKRPCGVFFVVFLSKLRMVKHEVMSHVVFKHEKETTINS